MRQSQGVDGIAMVATFYFRPQSLEELVEQCEYVAAARHKLLFITTTFLPYRRESFPDRLHGSLQAAYSKFRGFKKQFTRYRRLPTLYSFCKRTLLTVLGNRRNVYDALYCGKSPVRRQHL